MSFNNQLIKLRKRKNITQIELANLMNIKQYVISSWETGRSEPNLSQLAKLSELFEVPTDYLLDKVIIRANSEKEFNNVMDILKQDANDDFLKQVNALCMNLSKEKKEKMLDIIKASIDFNK